MKKYFILPFKVPYGENRPFMTMSLVMAGSLCVFYTRTYIALPFCYAVSVLILSYFWATKARHDFFSVDKRLKIFMVHVFIYMVVIMIIAYFPLFI
ncbi:MAG: hypothetical protein WC977_00310 [Anaerovoracaceae bacterium]